MKKKKQLSKDIFYIKDISKEDIRQDQLQEKTSKYII